MDAMDNLDSLDLDNTTFDHLNVSSGIKRLLQSKAFDKDDLDSQSDIEDEALFLRTPSVVTTPAVQSALEAARQLPAEDNDVLERIAIKDNELNQDRPQKEKNKTKTPKKPRKKAAKNVAEPPVYKNKITNFLAAIHDDSSDSDTDDNEPKAAKAPKPRKKRAPKQTNQAPSPIAESSASPSTVQSTTAAEPGHLFGFLDQSDSESEDETPRKSRPLSKRAAMLMRKEAQRITRTTVVTLQPRQNKLSFGPLLDRIKSQPVASFQSPKSPLLTPQTDRATSPMQGVTGNPTQSPVKSPVRYPVLSPVRHTRKNGMSHKELNRTLEERIAKEMLARRQEAQERAKAQGLFLTAEDLAKRQLQREKEAQVIDMQVRQHFEANTKPRKEIAPLHEEEGNNNQEEEEADMALEPIQYSGEEDEGEESEQGDNDDEDGMVWTSDEEGGQEEPSTLEGEPEQQDRDEEPSDEEDITKSNTRKRKRRAVVLDDDDEDEIDGRDKDADHQEPKENNTDQDTDTNDISMASFFRNREKSGQPANGKAPATKDKSQYLDAEAEEEEDEHFGAAGADETDDEDLDVFEQDDMLVDGNDEDVDEQELRAKLNEQVADSDKHMVDRILKDIMSGNLRRRRAAAEAGFMLDDYDFYDDEDNDLVAIRHAAAERRRRLLKSMGDNPLEALAQDPRTAAFAKAALPAPIDSGMMSLSEDEPDGNQDINSEEDSEAEMPFRRPTFKMKIR